MRVFVTGATGHLGSAVVPELLRADHEVVGLARSDAAEASLAERGVSARRGDLDDLDALRAGAEDSEGVIHLAYRHDLLRAGDLSAAGAVDVAAVRALGEALAGTGKPLVVTAGSLAVSLAVQGRAVTEEDRPEGGYRIDSENLTLGLARRGVRSSVIRLPPVVHSALDRTGFVPTLVDIARRAGRSAHVGDGTNRWPAVHTLDAARLYRLALESAPAGSMLHAVGDEGVPFRRIAQAIGHELGVPTTSIDPADVDAHFGFLAPFVTHDGPLSADVTRSLLGWLPTEPNLLDDLATGHYVAA